ncbi:hypothetical protein ACIPF8_23265 [Collimonas sp. NPDC087041]|uniref:hypothetical protein n=1 Tax=Collimonas sp. NPDC087041 TaxID=3363960 RepID=UPI00381E4DFD
MSSITLRNNTNYIVQYVVKKGQQIIARIPGIEPNAQITVPTNEIFTVAATAFIDGNSYTSAPQEIHGSMGFLAQVLQVPTQGTREFNVQTLPSNTPDALEFQKTCLGTVTFTISKNGVPLQKIVVVDGFMVQTLDISDTFYVYAVINGVTTTTTRFTNPSATITAITTNSGLESDYYTLSIN